MKLQQAHGIFMALSALASRQTMPLPAAVKIARNIKALRPEIEMYEVFRQKLLEKHEAKPGQQPGSFMIPNEHLPAFQTEMNALDNSRIKVQLTRIKASELGQEPILAGVMLDLGPLFLDDMPASQPDDLLEFTEEVEGEVLVAPMDIPHAPA